MCSCPFSLAGSGLKVSPVCSKQEKHESLGRVRVRPVRVK